VQVTPREFRFLLLPACYREDTPTGVWKITPTEVWYSPSFDTSYESGWYSPSFDTVSALVGLSAEAVFGSFQDPTWQKQRKNQTHTLRLAWTLTTKRPLITVSRTR